MRRQTFWRETKSGAARARSASVRATAAASGGALAAFQLTVTVFKINSRDEAGKILYLENMFYSTSVLKWESIVRRDHSRERLDTAMGQQASSRQRPSLASVYDDPSQLLELQQLIENDIQEVRQTADSI